MTLRKRQTQKASLDSLDGLEKAGAGPRLRKVRTHYHPMAFSLVQSALPAPWEAISEHSLHHEPQRVDILVIRRKAANAVAADVLEEQLPSLVRRLGERATVLEFKGPTDRLVSWDVMTVVGYGMQLCVQQRYKSEQVTLGVLVSRISTGFIDAVETQKGKLEQTGQGQWDGHVAGFRVFVLELSRIWRGSDAERLWYVLTPGFMRDRTPMRGLSEYQQFVYIRMYEQFRREIPAGGDQMKAYDDYMEKILKQYLDSDKREKILRWLKLKPEERLSGLRPEERLSGLRPEERLAGLRPEERLSGLRPEEITELLQHLQAKASKSGLQAS